MEYLDFELPIKELEEQTDSKYYNSLVSKLEKIKDNYPKFLLTTDGFTQNRSGIKHLNVFNWLLETN